MNIKTINHTCAVLCLLFTLPLAGCRRSGPPAAPAGSKVARIVFVDKQNACKCTRAKVDATWESLKIAVADHSKIPVERIHIDTQEDKVAPYKKMRPIMAVPAVYFLDAKGRLIGMLQGELQAAQIAKYLEKK